LGTIDDVAATASFLASEDASFITGTEAIVDGGLLARQITIAPSRLLAT
jgi:NAD(P)-dependent dehydrogenase (short-subunit alcohol dehydrogenase family)